jgi:cytidylate kinase
MAVLTISREFRSGSQEIGRMIAERMGYTYIGKEQILTDMRSAGERCGRLLTDLDEATPSVWERFDNEYRGFIALVESYIFEYARRDRTIIVGRGGTHLLCDIPFVLRVRLGAPLEIRVDRAMRKDQVDRETAKWLIQTIDRSRAGYIQANYGIDWNDQRCYDMIFNTGVQSYELIVDILASALQDRDSKVTPEWKDILLGRKIAARIRAAVLMHPKLNIPTLRVDYEKGSLFLRGVIHSRAEYDRVEKLAKKIAKSIPVCNGLRFRK